jgi:hypothetical protein
VAEIKSEAVVRYPQAIVTEGSDIMYFLHDAVHAPSAEIPAEDGLGAELTVMGTSVGGHDAGRGEPLPFLPCLLISVMTEITSIRDGQAI